MLDYTNSPVRAAKDLEEEARVERAHPGLPGSPGFGPGALPLRLLFLVFKGCRRSSCAGVARRETSTALSSPSGVYRARTPHARRLRIASRLWVTLAGLSPPLRRPENGAERGSRTRLASLEGWNLTDRSVPRFVYVRPLGPLASIAANQRTSAPRGARRDSLRPPATTIHRGRLPVASHAANRQSPSTHPSTSWARRLVRRGGLEPPRGLRLTGF